MSEQHPQTNGGRLLKRGDTFDIECWRTTHRLSVGQAILRNLGIKAEWPQHDETCILHPKNQMNRCFGYSYRCECSVGTDPQPTWPEWVTGDVFDLAYRLADEVQTERGSYERNRAWDAKQERERARRAEATS